MPKITTTCVEMTCLQGLADLERLEGPLLELIAGGFPEGAAVILHLLLAHMASMSKRMLGAMVLDRLDVEVDSVETLTASEAVSVKEQPPDDKRNSRNYQPGRYS